MGLTVELKALFPITKLFKREKHDAKDITTLPFFHLKTGRVFLCHPFILKNSKFTKLLSVCHPHTNGAIPPQEGAFSWLGDLREEYDSS